MRLQNGEPATVVHELAFRFRQDPALAGCRLIALTGYGQEADRERSVRAGFDRHLVKPVDADVVMAAVAGLG